MRAPPQPMKTYNRGRSIKAPQDREPFDRARDERRAHAYALQICECLFPNERAETATQHPEECPAHAFLLKRFEMGQVFLMSKAGVAIAGGSDAKPMTLDEVKEALAIGAKKSAAARKHQKRRGRW